MTDPADPPAPRNHIAKVIARAGVASRRDAVRLIAEGRVALNGKVLTTPVIEVSDADVITVDGQLVGPPERVRLFRYHKPKGLVTTNRDELGRETIFDHLPPGLPRLLTVGRLDLTSEGLLLLTNDGALKRKLELPSTGWLRKYRVRVHGEVSESRLRPLSEGLSIDGIDYQPMLVQIDQQQGANAWLTIGLREGKNREIRRAMEAVGLIVNRLIRVAYGPFRLGDLPPGAVEEVRTQVLREQLGIAVETPHQEEMRQRRAGLLPARQPMTQAPTRRPRAADGQRAMRAVLAAEDPGQSLRQKLRRGEKLQRRRDQAEARMQSNPHNRAERSAGDNSARPAMRPVRDGAKGNQTRGHDPRDGSRQSPPDHSGRRGRR